MFELDRASMKFQIVGLAQLTILLKPLCDPSARLEDLGSPQMVASHWFHPSLSKRGSEEGVPRTSAPLIRPLGTKERGLSWKTSSKGLA